MTTYLIESTFTAPFETFGATVAAHRSYLQQGYDAGWILLSGPKTDKSGGIIIARSDTPDMLSSFFDADPYRQTGLAIYRFTPFSAAKHAECLTPWLDRRVLS